MFRSVNWKFHIKILILARLATNLTCVDLCGLNEFGS